MTFNIDLQALIKISVIANFSQKKPALSIKTCWFLFLRLNYSKLAIIK